MCDYTPRDDYELPFNTNDMISVIEKLDDTWWSGKLNGLVGCFPVAFTGQPPLLVFVDCRCGLLGSCGECEPVEDPLFFHFASLP